MIQIPPYLKPGDTIGLTCPAGYMPEENYQTCIQVLKEWGFNVVVGSTPGHQFHYFSGTDAERLQDLQSMLDNDDIDAILCARGGYGTGRIIDFLDFTKFSRKPKWIAGFSDITVLHSHLMSNYQIASLHAPMAAAFNDDEYKNEYVQSLYDALTGKVAAYNAAPHPMNKRGIASGRLAGGNLSLLANLVGTPSDPDMEGKILFIEDVGEYIYNVDRMMYQLKRSGKLKNLAALIVGHFSEMMDTTIPIGQTSEELIRDIVSEYDYPVCYRFPVSHDKENYALKVGVNYTLAIEEFRVTLTEG